VGGRRPAAADYSLYDLVDCNLRLNAKLLADFPLMKVRQRRSAMQRGDLTRALP
jgi:hypothetical protein